MAVAALVAAVIMAGCAGQGAGLQGPGNAKPALRGQTLIAADGFHLRMRRWLPPRPADAVVLALHGFNDYGASFDGVAEVLRADGIAVYAPDQRGHGRSGPRGLWPGRETLVADAVTALRLLQQRYPEQPVYLLGESMGAAVALLAAARPQAPRPAGVVLLAPAVWGERVMPWYQRLGLSVGPAVAPGLELPVRLAWLLGNHPSDEAAVLQQLRADPLVQDGARLDTLQGLAGLMDAALAASPQLPAPALILYGEQDAIIPSEAVCHMLAGLPVDDGWRMALYPDGYHLLTRYSGADSVLADLRAWFQEPSAALPSGRSVTRAQALARLCP